MSDINEVFKNRPTNPLCDKNITVDIVGTRCVYLNNHRIAGGKPYVSEGLSQRSRNLTIREALEAFPIATLEAYISEKKARKKYFDDYHANKSKGACDE